MITRVIAPILVLFLLAASIVAAPRGPALPRPVVFDADQRIANQPYVNAITQAETTVAVHPLDPRIMVAGFFDNQPTPADRICGHSRTIDGGRTWTLGGGPPKQFDTSGCHDPAITVDAAGRFYYAYLESRHTSGNFVGGVDILVAKSIDDGLTFPTYSVAYRESPSSEFFPDKEFLAADVWPKSRHRGNLYLAWTAFGNDGVDIRVQTSRDGGETWTSPTRVSRLVPYEEFSTVSGATPVVAPDGTAYVFYLDAHEPALRSDIMFARSADGGRTWGAPAAVARDLPTPGHFVLENSSQGFGTDANVGLIGNSFPAVAIASNGSIHVAWADFANGACTDVPGSRDPCRNADVRLSVSRDGGKSWSGPIKVTDETGDSDQVFPAIGVHPDGLVSLQWIDRRLDPQNENYDVFYTNTPDGRTFLPNVRVTRESSTLRDYNWIGDYNALAVTAGTVVPLWGDRRNLASLDVYAARGVLQNP